MCFSATASFTAGAVLTAAGVATVSQVKKRQDRLLASLPFLFGIQQFLEGFIWLYPDTGLITRSLAYGFLFFAFLLWPVYIPLSVWSHETDPERKCLLHYLIAFGFAGTLYLGAVLLTQALDVQIVNESIRYAITVPVETPGLILYLIVTVGAMLLSSRPMLNLFGLLTLLSAWISWQFYAVTFTSVWCYFAAILSLYLFFYFRFDKTS
ncbi:hypothetical protein HY631_03640 [Candidatus Uhrbacteria bacterium]|nr:hypothetical protein [Candidatus Uhrbacteria bacterium]